MILVSGTKRSGTSMWMGALHAAGVPVIGETWPRDWGDRALRDANPDGFYESSLREGVNFLSNPDPASGTFLHPSQVQGHAVKVFLSGLARTDLAYIDRALVSMRPWGEYVASMQRLRALERQDREVPGAERRPLVHALEWWVENYLGLRDILMRGYPCHVVSYRTVLEHPERVMSEVFGWLGVAGDAKAAAEVVRGPTVPAATAGPDALEGLPAHCGGVFDELHERVYGGSGLDDAFIAQMNELHQQLLPWVHNLLHEAKLANEPAPAP